MDRLDVLVQDLMTINQIERGQISMHFETFDLVELTIEIMEQVEVKAKEKEIKLSLGNSPDKYIYVSADYRRIYQVILNLVSNAINYSGIGSKVVFKISNQPNKVLFELTDNGVGIPIDHLKRIFERFYRVDKSRSKETGGSGLGLSIVKHILESHKSKINVESTVGKGTKFWFYLDKGKIEPQHKPLNIK